MEKLDDSSCEEEDEDKYNEPSEYAQTEVNGEVREMAAHKEEAGSMIKRPRSDF